VEAAVALMVVVVVEDNTNIGVDELANPLGVL